MGTTANWSLEYPASTGHTRLWEHIQTLADDAEAALDLLASRYGCPAAPITTGSNGTATSGTTETPDSVLGVYTFTALADVRYRVTLAGRGISMSVANDRFSLKLRYTTNGSTPTAESTLIAHDSTFVNPGAGGNYVSHIPHVVTFAPGAATVKVISTWTRANGTGVGTPVGSCEMWAEAIGPV